MRIGYLNSKSTAPELPSDMRLFIRLHRDNPIHRRIIEQYRIAHPLCEWCLRAERTRSTEEVHHIVPVADRGKTTPENLLGLCCECHLRIGELTQDEQRKLKTES